MARDIDESARLLVIERARRRCEYCLVHEDNAGFPHQIDHIISRKHGGSSGIGNLAYACILCNRYKGTDIASIDHAGRPHSKDLRVTEIFHRLDHDRMEHTLIIDDAQMYTEPWMAQNKLVLYLQSPDFDIRENFCVPSENAEYNKVVGVHTKDTPAVKEPNPENK